MSFSSQLLRAARLTLALWLLTVVLTSLPMLGLARLVANDSANGSLLQRDGVVVGSRLIGQRFSSGRYLNGRPFGNASLSAANPLLAKRVAEAAKGWQAAGIHQPASDLLLDSGSGVDPHISLEAARQQLPGLAAPALLAGHGAGRPDQAPPGRADDAARHPTGGQCAGLQSGS